MDQNNTTSGRGSKGTTSSSSRRRPKTGASVQMQVQDHIGRQLRAVYDDLLSQPVPDRFLELLEQLDKKPGTAGQSSRSESAAVEAPPSKAGKPAEDGS